MDFFKDEQLHLWARNLSLVTAFVVCLLSWLNGITFGWIVIRVILTYLILYGLSLGSLVLFVKTAYSDLNEGVSEQNHSQGTSIDISLGDDVVDQTNSVPNVSETGVGAYAGQVDPALASGVVGYQQQAEIIRRMGWKE